MVAFVCAYSALLFVVGVSFIVWGVQEKKRAKRNLDWVDDMRKRHPWLKAPKS